MLHRFIVPKLVIIWSGKHATIIFGFKKLAGSKQSLHASWQQKITMWDKLVLEECLLFMFLYIVCVGMRVCLKLLLFCVWCLWRAVADTRADTRGAALQLGCRRLQSIQQAIVVDALARERASERRRDHHCRSWLLLCAPVCHARAGRGACISMTVLAYVLSRLSCVSVCLFVLAGG